MASAGGGLRRDLNSIITKRTSELTQQLKKLNTDIDAIYYKIARRQLEMENPSIPKATRDVMEKTAAQLDKTDRAEINRLETEKKKVTDEIKNLDVTLNSSVQGDNTSPQYKEDLFKISSDYNNLLLQSRSGSSEQVKMLTVIILDLLDREDKTLKSSPLNLFGNP